MSCCSIVLPRLDGWTDGQAVAETKNNDVNFVIAYSQLRDAAAWLQQLASFILLLSPMYN